MCDLKWSYFKETSAATFPISGFPWRELAIVGCPGWRGAATPFTPDLASSVRGFSGGFHYGDSARVSNLLCRNRFILW